MEIWIVWRKNGMEDDEEAESMIDIYASEERAQQEGLTFVDQYKHLERYKNCYYSIVPTLLDEPALSLETLTAL